MVDGKIRDQRSYVDSGVQHSYVDSGVQHSYVDSGVQHSYVDSGGCPATFRQYGAIVDGDATLTEEEL